MVTWMARGLTPESKVSMTVVQGLGLRLSYKVAHGVYMYVCS